uniref:Uncharacterized protein n=1 Tax=Arundo donax TaxID=35708 RepID=A0A0A9CI36_ARUDO
MSDHLVTDFFFGK